LDLARNFVTLISSFDLGNLAAGEFFSVSFLFAVKNVLLLNGGAFSGCTSR
jgi:hypothetical protein